MEDLIIRKEQNPRPIISNPSDPRNRGRVDNWVGIRNPRARLWNVLNQAPNLGLFPSELLRHFQRYQRTGRTQDSYIAIVQFLESMRILASRHSTIRLSDVMTLDRHLCTGQNVQNELWEKFWAESCQWLDEQRQGLSTFKSQKLHNDFVLRIRKTNKVTDPLEAIDKTFSNVSDIQVNDAFADSLRHQAYLSNSWIESDVERKTLPSTKMNLQETSKSEESKQNRKPRTNERVDTTTEESKRETVVSYKNNESGKSLLEQEKEDRKMALRLASQTDSLDGEDFAFSTDSKSGSNTMSTSAFDFSKLGLSDLKDMVTTTEDSVSSGEFMDACREELCRRLETYKDWNSSRRQVIALSASIEQR